MTTRSGWKRLAASMASATVPASATTWNPGRRSSMADRPSRTTSWSSTIRSVSTRAGPVDVSVMRGSSSVFAVGVRRQGDPHGRASGSALEGDRGPDLHGPRAHVGQALVAQGTDRRGVEAVPIIGHRDVEAAVVVDVDL